MKFRTHQERESEVLSEADRIKLDNGDWYRAGGECICTICNQIYDKHPLVEGANWLNRLCNGDLVKP